MADTSANIRSVGPSDPADWKRERDGNYNPTHATHDHQGTKERLHKLVDELSEAEALRARVVVEDEQFLQKLRHLDARATAEAYEAAPQLADDGWPTSSRSMQTRATWC